MDPMYKMADEKLDDPLRDSYYHETPEEAARNAKLTRRILLKFDFRYAHVEDVHAAIAEAMALMQRLEPHLLMDTQDTPRACSPLPLLIPGSNQCRKCEDSWFGEGSRHH